MLVPVMQWWSGKNRDCWNMEQQRAQVPLSQVMFMEKEDRLQEGIDGNYHYNCLIEIWDRYRKGLAPPTLPCLMSLIYHSKFWVAAQRSDFSYWTRGDMDRFYQLSRVMRMLTQQQIEQTVGRLPEQDYQYIQVKSLIGKINRTCNGFRPLTQFQTPLKSEGGGHTTFQDLFCAAIIVLGRWG